MKIVIDDLIVLMNADRHLNFREVSDLGNKVMGYSELS